MDSEPKSFADAIADVEAGRIVDLETALNEAPMHEAPMHEYHCVFDGTQLREIGLGFLMCSKCKRQYLPHSSSDERTMSLTWSEEDEGEPT